MNIGPAYNLNLVQGQVGCKNCDDSVLKNLTVDGMSYPQTDQQNNDYYINVEPNTGFMISTMKDTTVYLWFKKTQSLAFPDLDYIGQQLIPFYDFKESIMIDTEIWNNDYNFISADLHKKLSITVAFGVLFGVFLIVGIVMLIIWFTKYNQGKKNYLDYPN